MKIIKKTALFLTILLIFTLAACSQDNNNVVSDDNNNNDGNNPAETQNHIPDGVDESENKNENEYIFPEVNYGDSDFTVLNTDIKVFVANYWSDVTVGELNGEILNDTIFNRNIFVEDLFGIRIKESSFHPDDVIRRARTIIQSGDNTFDAMIVSHNWNGSIGTLAFEGGLHNLSEIPEFQSDMPWWNQNINEQCKIGGSDSLYFSVGNIEVYPMQTPLVLFFNENMAQDLGLDMPYNAVRSGKWTLDEYEKYIKAATNLNGDDNWKWTSSGNSIYGHASYHMGATAMLFGSDVQIIGFDGNNIPYLAVENEHFYNAVEKLSQILSVDGQYNYEDTGGMHRNDVFMNRRSLFVDAPIGNNGVLRAFEDSYGILPIPKYDEKQENYNSIIHAATTFTAIPATASDSSKSAIVLDALAYLSYRDVRPVYFDVVLTNKQLRNEDSIDMLQIILDSRSVHIGYIYDWTTTFLNNDMRTAIQKSNPDIASVIEKNKELIELNIQNTLDFFENN
jgi:hypothetical protein